MKEATRKRIDAFSTLGEAALQKMYDLADKKVRLLQSEKSIIRRAIKKLNKTGEEKMK